MDLNNELLLKYALVHDLVEVHAGDTDPYKGSKEFIASKEQREREALKRIKQDFPDFKDLYESIEKFEALEDKEAKFVYLVDKILPVINTYLAHDSYYAKNGVSYIFQKHGERFF